MADRGIQIKEELLLHFCRLEVPPGTDVGNLRIHVEREINRIKSFRILKNTLPVSLSQHIDDILWKCTALCNLKPKLFCSKKEEYKSNV